MRIAIVCAASIKTVEVQFAIRAINSQIRDDFAPEWNIGQSSLFLSSQKEIVTPRLDASGANGIIYIVDDDSSVDMGAHMVTPQGVPWGVVDVNESRQAAGGWTTTLSHEALEMLANPHTNRLVIGPDTEDGTRHPLYPVEVCDPVSESVYCVGGVAVSNFVLPSWFILTGDSCPVDYPVDYLGECKGPWDIAPGGFAVYASRLTGVSKSSVRLGDDARMSALPARAARVAFGLASV